MLQLKVWSGYFLPFLSGYNSLGKKKQKKNTLVRVRKTSWYGLGDLFWLPQTSLLKKTQTKLDASRFTELLTATITSWWLGWVNAESHHTDIAQREQFQHTG